MKVGSLVEYIGVCLHSDWTIKEATNLGVIIPTPGVPYTVRAINKHKEGCYILLEEIINPIAINNEEFDYNINHFRELQPPMCLVEELQLEAIGKYHEVEVTMLFNGALCEGCYKAGINLSTQWGKKKSEQLHLRILQP